MSSSVKTHSRYANVRGSLFGWVCMSVITGGLLLAVGCGREAAREPAGDVGARPADVALPEWAPKAPTKAFLRAARVLKAIPEDAHPYSPLFPVVYELFGTLSDEQVETFLTPKQRRISLANIPEARQSSFKENLGAWEAGDELVYETREIYIPFATLAPAQRAAFDNMVDAWAKANEGQPETEDLLVCLYRLGAREDLSNVQIGFQTAGRHAVHLRFVVEVQEIQGGQTVTGSSSLTTWVAQL